MHDDVDHMKMVENNRVHSKASLTPEILKDRKDNQHKAQISRITFIDILSYCTVV